MRRQPIVFVRVFGENIHKFRFICDPAGADPIIAVPWIKREIGYSHIRPDWMLFDVPSVSASRPVFTGLLTMLMRSSLGCGDGARE